MIFFLKAILLGIIQGVTEFLPISSTGHMILVEKIASLGDRAFADGFMTMIQLGSILAVVLYFFPEIKNLLWQLLGKKSEEPMEKTGSPWLILLAVVPALLIGGLFGGVIQRTLYSTKTVAIALFLGGWILLAAEWRKEGKESLPLAQMNWRQALWIGLAQCVAMIPGVSRSAATIVGGRLTGLSRVAAVTFSFYLAIPTMCAATGYSLLKGVGHFSFLQWGAIAIGFVTAFLTSWGVIAFLMRFIRQRDLKLFGWYRILLGILLLILG